MQFHSIYPLAALLFLCLATSVARGDEISKDKWQVLGTSLNKLFDFQNYKRIFNKSYSSLTEELARQKLFMTDALRAFISIVRYEHHQQPYHLSPNDMSDKTPEELHKMDNKVLDQRGGESKKTGGNKESDSSELPVLDSNKYVERELLEYIDTHKDEPSARDVLNMLMKGESDVPTLDEIESETGIKMGAEAARSPKPYQQFKPVHPLKNQQIGRRAAMMVAEQKEVKFWEVGQPPKKGSNPVRPQIPEGFFAKLRYVFSDPEHEPPPELGKPDEVFLDLRSTNCLTTPRRQGQCASCYAFATVTIFEWLYCMKTGEQLEFSEQYMIDCGEDYVQDLSGCAGGTPLAAANFVLNFGLELREKYPYRASVQQCPYPENFNPQSTGQIRFHLTKGLMIHSRAWPVVLESGPLLVGVWAAPYFQQYAGGVHGFGCSESLSVHAMVLVGHGRERGEPYWLLRNSYGTKWGEQGYYKLAKRANCVYEGYGVSFGGHQGVRGRDIVKQNENYDESFVRHHNEMLGPAPDHQHVRPK